ncbi:hypothetical protein Sm713_35150 [Streptomyces sp. TS71-3]|nr:hypothetical protein Sm713_35150 [Streptomyces sp. TS71-3]
MTGPDTAERIVQYGRRGPAGHLGAPGTMGYPSVEMTCQPPRYTMDCGAHQRNTSTDGPDGAPDQRRPGPVRRPGPTFSN